ncbi:glycoside hydrolase family 44-domain-containing protein [Pholiota molesta]|nr:glycoside hydrolase family 44-domain-containing protein [Pholiota molesta]
MVPKLNLLRFAACVAFAALHAVKADIAIYTDAALASGWENWSWSSDINFAATDEFAGTSGSSISVNSSAYAALSVKLEGTFPSEAGLRFDIAGTQPDVTILVQSTGDGDQSASIPLSAISTTVVDGTFSSLLINFSDLPGTGGLLGNDTWDRITFQAGGNGAIYHLDNVVLVDQIVIPPEVLSAEPLADSIIAVTTQGAVDLSDISVTLNGTVIKIVNQTTYNPVDTPAQTITYLHLAIVQQVSTPINPHIYGVNFPTSASYIQHLGVTISRWGGNAVTAYNPFGGFTNAGNDWYFENRVIDNGDADDWMAWVGAAGSDSLLTIPALDWVSKDSTSYSYPKGLTQVGIVRPLNNVSGDGLLPNGSYVTPVPDPTNNKPLMVAIDNEIEIASNTHQDMHPQLMGYDEELARVIEFATAAKEALPDVLVVAPSTCSWWYYWTSSIGYTDNAAHNNMISFLAHDQSTGKRLLDYLDLHYYFQPDTSANDAAAKALRLRMTRSLWLRRRILGGSNPQNHQWNPTAISLIPRFKTLIQINYPGTKLSISEWSSTADTDLTGGLLTVDVLDYTVNTVYGTLFANATAQVNLATPNPDTQGVYAGTQNGKLSLVIVNKNPDTPISFYLANTTISLKINTYLVVPAYTALFLQQQ